jgi:riboflavin synthase
MFTGLVEAIGHVVESTDEPAGVRLRIRPPAQIAGLDATNPSVQIGESVAINGCCLTVVASAEGVWEFQAGAETLSRTNLGRLAAGDSVNLERSLKLGDRLGGHMVQGHIDGTGEVLRIVRQDEWTTMWFKTTSALTRQMVTKGSVAIDGVSLTLVDVEDETFNVALIPHTLEMTTLGLRQIGDAVNIETDILGKYVEKLVARLPRGDA